MNGPDQLAEKTAKRNCAWVDATTLEANARRFCSVARHDTGRPYEEFLTRLANFGWLRGFIVARDVHYPSGATVSRSCTAETPLRVLGETFRLGFGGYRCDAAAQSHYLIRDVHVNLNRRCIGVGGKPAHNLAVKPRIVERSAYLVPQLLGFVSSGAPLVLSVVIPGNLGRFHINLVRQYKVRLRGLRQFNRPEAKVFGRDGAR